MTTSFKKRLTELESSNGGHVDIRSLTDEELWALLPSWWRTLPDAVFDELALLDRKTEAGRQRYRELKKMYGSRRQQDENERG